MNFFTVAGIFKNESHVIKEWVEHYLNEGADHFLLIDNGSTDNYKREINEYLDNGLITIIHDDTKWAQIELYNKYFPPLSETSKWLLICDLDEFVYARRGYNTIAQFLSDLSEKVGAIRIPWKMFGSNGQVEQPDLVIPSFTKRELVGKSHKPWVNDKKKTLSKVIVRPQLVHWYNLHFSMLTKGAIVLGANKKRMKYSKESDENHFQPVSERILKKSYLHLNHYALQSKQWFMDVKCQRGAADLKDHDEVRDLKYFEDYDQVSNDVIDNELAIKKY